METEQASPNQSPDTQDEPAEEVDLGKMVSDAVEEATKPLKEEIESLKKGSTTSTSESPPSKEALPESQTSSTTSSGTPTTRPDVAREVERALADRDHAAQHAALAEVGGPPKPRERKGLGKLIWG